VQLSKIAEIHSEFHTRPGTADHALAREAQEGFYDLVIIGRGKNIPPSSDIERLIRRVLVTSEAPVLLAAEKSPKLRRMLICTAAGEPGKMDVRFSGRLARHTGGAATVFHVLRSNATSEDKARAMHHLEQAHELLEGYNIETSIKLSPEPLLPAILGELSKDDYDVLVLGSPAPRDRRKAASNLLADVAAQTDCSLLIVPTPL
jgi:nucleotide-binding universal stress UspA family protein